MGNVKPDQSARALNHWRGPLFNDWYEVERYKDGWPTFRFEAIFGRPSHVTFPICCGCGHIIWDDPHFEEKVPDETICSHCFCEMENE